MEVYSMYSIVLMAAISGSGDLPAFGHPGGCCGCKGGHSSSCCGDYGCGCGGGGHRRGHRHGGGCGCCGQTYSCGCCGASACCGSGCEAGEGMEGEHHRAHPSTKEPEKIGKPKEGKKATRGPAPAPIIVSLPANATLTVDDTVTKSTS